MAAPRETITLEILRLIQLADDLRLLADTGYKPAADFARLIEKRAAWLIEKESLKR